MSNIRRVLRVIAGAFLFAMVLVVLMAAPGFLTNEASTSRVISVTSEMTR